MSESENKIIQLYPDIGYHLLNFLDGIDVCNFIEVVNDSNQFSSIATATDCNFRNLIQKIFCYGQKTLLPKETFENYLDDCEVVDDRLIWIENRNSSFIQPRQRLFVYRCFSIEGFGKLCRVYRTPLFECYSRLLSFNTDLYCADFGLVDYALYMSTIVLERELNDHERKLFKSKTFKIENEKHIFAIYSMVIELMDRTES
jgi:hypothetical protein